MSKHGLRCPSLNHSIINPNFVGACMPIDYAIQVPDYGFGGGCCNCFCNSLHCR